MTAEKDELDPRFAGPVAESALTLIQDTVTG